MLRRIVFLLGIIIALVAIGFIGMRKYTKSFSPSSVASFEKNALNIKVFYCQPYKKNRQIFGDNSNMALVPYGSVWRTGANEATEIEFNQDLLFSGSLLKKGRYALFTIPEKNSWTIIFNDDLGQWGAFDYTKSKDALRIVVPIEKSVVTHEQFNIALEEHQDRLGMTFAWENIQVKIPIEKP